MPSLSRGVNMNTAVTWNNTYSVNVKELDNQHKKLIGLINELLELEDNIDNLKLDKTIEQLFDYIDYHLRYEEDVLLKNGYPRFDEHKNSHTVFEQKIQDFKDRLKLESGKSLVFVINNFLLSWLIEHIKKVDKEYSKFLNSKGIV